MASKQLSFLINIEHISSEKEELLAEWSVYEVVLYHLISNAVKCSGSRHCVRVIL